MASLRRRKAPKHWNQHVVAARQREIALTCIPRVLRVRERNAGNRPPRPTAPEDKNRCAMPSRRYLFRRLPSHLSYRL
jgi:hypothetical protein